MSAAEQAALVLESIADRLEAGESVTGAGAYEALMALDAVRTDDDPHWPRFGRLGFWPRQMAMSWSAGIRLSEHAVNTIRNYARDLRAWDLARLTTMTPEQRDAVITYAAALSAAGYRAYAAAGLMARGRAAALAVIRDAAKILETITGDATAERVRWTIKQTRSARSCEERRDRVLAMLAEAMKEGADHA